MNTLPKVLKRDDYIQEGANPAAGVVLLACTVGEDYDNPRNRVHVVRDAVVATFEFGEDEVVSIDASAEGGAWVLGENGSVITFDWRTADDNVALARMVRRYIIDGVEGEGPLCRLRLLGSEVVCAGSLGQAYHLQEGRFVRLPQLVVAGEDVTIEDLAGTAVDDFVAVTSEGYAAQFDGRDWHKIDLPSSAALNCITLLGDGRYAIGGDSGTLVVGAREHWQALPLADAERDYWGIAAEGDTIYLAHVGGIDMVAGSDAQALKIPPRRQNEFVVLRSGADGVWSFAGRSVGLITAGLWRVML